MIIKPEDLKINKSENYIVGLSGGADSLCLTILLHELNLNMSACIIDHKLRPESSTEILPIIDILKKRKIKYEVLTWNHCADIGGNIEQKAREARYDLLYKYCKDQNCNNLCIAHHGLDQWETFFMRLSKGSGIRGLSSIQPIIKYKDINILRPLLDFSPADIKETLRYYGIFSYVLDPMNNDLHYERVRWRKAYSDFEKYNLNIKNINKSIERIQLANNCLDKISQEYMYKIFDEKVIKLDEFRKLHLEIQMRILNLVVLKFFPEKQIISYDLLMRMALKISSKNFVATNFSGLIFKRSKNIIVFLENRIKFKKNNI